MPRHLSISVLILALAFLATSCLCTSRQTQGEPVQEEEPVFYPLGFNPDTLLRKDFKVQKNEFFSTLLQRRGMRQGEIPSFVRAVSDTFDPRKLRTGVTYNCYYGQDDTTRLDYIVYNESKIRQLIFDCREPYSTWTYEKPVTCERKVTDITIENSLWQDMTAAGASQQLIFEVSDIYAWTVDFFGLRKGDRFHVVYDELFVDGQSYKIDTVRAVVFSSGGKDFPCVMFNQGDGGNRYWNEKGESMRKAFLKAPLHFSRISSGFSYARVHPVTRKVQPHTGVDYAAPAGTPVVSIGDGVVLSCKNEGAGGNTIRIRHNSVYTTAYLHLKGYAKNITPGARVSQGQTIGYVGSTGRSTGPHLDFRVWKNGSPINPLTMDSPPAVPLNKSNMEAFADTAARYGITVPLNGKSAKEQTANSNQVSQE